MRCPNCGTENDSDVCTLCGTRLKKKMDFKQFVLNLSLPVKITAIVWTFAWISGLFADSEITIPQMLCVAVFGYVIYCGIAHILYKRYNQKHTVQIAHSSQKLECINNKSLDPLFASAGYSIISYGKASIGMLQRIYKISFNQASKIIDDLCEYGVVGEEEGVKPRKVLMSAEQFKLLLLSLNSANVPIKNECQNLSDIDSMEGHDFEYFCADILRKNGFDNVEVTQGSGDHGIDILAEKDDISYAIQCKCYSSNIGNAAVQQAHTGKSLYKKNVAVVLTNRYFTAQAKEEANQLGVKLWDRDKLNELINKASITS